MWCVGKKTLSENVVIITGASSGIGEASALRFAEEGCRVVLAARRKERINDLAEKIHITGGQALAVQTDVSQPDSLSNLVQTVLAEWGQIDLLFNNAGFGRLRFLDELDPIQDIETQLHVNLRGVDPIDADGSSTHDQKGRRAYHQYGLHCRFSGDAHLQHLCSDKICCAGFHGCPAQGSGCMGGSCFWNLPGGGGNRV